VASDAAIAATSEAIRSLLERAAPASEIAPTPHAEHLTPVELQTAPGEGTDVTIGVYLHRVAVSATRSNAGPRTLLDGTRVRPGIPLDLHYLIVPRASDPLMQQLVLGWAVRILDETPILPAGLLNSHQRGRTVFDPAESVEFVWQILTQQELFDIWEVAKTNQQPCAAYVARAVTIFSKVPIDEHPPVQTRRFGYGDVREPTGGPA
jgi:hypothetical protein